MTTCSRVKTPRSIGLAPNFSGSQNGMNFINGRLFAGQGLSSGGNDFNNIMQAYGPQMRNLGIMR
jgi:hypothetical protein